MTNVADVPESVRALLLTLADGQLILPYSVVQEIISWREPDALPEGPDWLLGVIPWRRWKLPVVSAERLAGSEFAAPARKAHIVVCSLLTGDEEMPCVGILTQNVPQLVRADAETVALPGEMVEKPWAAAQLLYNGAYSWVPDFQALAGALPRPSLT